MTWGQAVAFDGCQKFLMCSSFIKPALCLKKLEKILDKKILNFFFTLIEIMPDHPISFGKDLEIIPFFEYNLLYRLFSSKLMLKIYINN